MTDDSSTDEAFQRIADERLWKILPARKKGEKKDKFVSRCMSSVSMNREFPNHAQRFAVCQSQASKK